DGACTITPDLLPPDILGAASDDGERPLREIVREVEAATIESRLRRHRYHRGDTARSLGVTREWLWAKMRKLGLTARDPGGEPDNESGASSPRPPPPSSKPPRACPAHLPP